MSDESRRQAADRLATAKAIEQVFEECHTRFTQHMADYQYPIESAAWMAVAKLGIHRVEEAMNHEEKLGAIKSLSAFISGSLIDLYRLEMYKSLGIRDLQKEALDKLSTEGQALEAPQPAVESK